MINNLSPNHRGVMPIRVLQYNLITAFENINPEFLTLSKKVMTEKGLQAGITYDARDSAAVSPKVVFQKIMVNESFLSYVWCISYSMTILYEEVIVKLSKNDFFRNEEETINPARSEKAYQLWEYAIRLIREYERWDLSLPNPERYDELYSEIIPKINSLYLSAMKFVLAHEFAHVELDHQNRYKKDENLDIQNIEFEKEADARAIELNLLGVTEENKITTHMGILTGLCSLLFFSSITKGVRYPDTNDRIDAIIRIVQPSTNQDAMWGFATLAYKLWDRLYNIGLEWKEGLDSPKALYHDIKSQVEARN